MKHTTIETQLRKAVVGLQYKHSALLMTKQPKNARERYTFDYRRARIVGWNDPDVLRTLSPQAVHSFRQVHSVYSKAEDRLNEFQELKNAHHGEFWRDYSRVCPYPSVNRFPDMHEVSHIPHAGDVIRLTGKWSIAEIGDILVIQGGTHQDMRVETGPILCAYSVFNDGEYVSGSGGPGTIGGIPTSCLKWTGETMSYPFWKWKDHPRKDGGLHYTLDVNVWEWDGVKPPEVE